MQVIILIDKLDENIDAKDLFGRTALMLACLLTNEKRAESIIKFLLRRKALVSLDAVGLKPT